MEKILSTVKKGCLGAAAAVAVIVFAASAFGAEPTMKDKLKDQPAGQKQSLPAPQKQPPLPDIVPGLFWTIPPSGAKHYGTSLKTDVSVGFANFGMMVWNSGTVQTASTDHFVSTITCAGVPFSGKNGATPQCPEGRTSATCPIGFALAPGNGLWCPLVGSEPTFPLPRFHWEAGKYTIEVRVDTTDAVKEVNEGNNSATYMVEVLSK